MLRSLSAAMGLLDGASAAHFLRRQHADITCLRHILATVGSVLSREMNTAAPAARAVPTAESEPSSSSMRETAPEVDGAPVRTRRAGLIAVKVGMTQEWDHWGARIPLSVLWVDECQVVQVKRPETDGYLALQLGCGAKRPKQVSGTLRGHFSAAGVPIKRKVAEFRVTPDAVLPVGFSLLASHFVAGQYVDVSGTSIGKGFQGVMKRWGFAGQPASHGNSLAHRGAGSTGGCQDPGKVFKGKKMAGRMGGKRTTVQSCQVWRIDPQRNLIYVRGQIPGHKGNFVLIRDAVRKQAHDQPPLPVPSVTEGEIGEITVAQKQGTDPFEYKE